MDTSKVNIARLNLDLEVYTTDLKTKEELEAAWAHDKPIELEGLTFRVVDHHTMPNPKELGNKFEPLIFWFQLKFWTTEGEPYAILKRIVDIHRTMVK